MVSKIKKYFLALVIVFVMDIIWIMSMMGFYKSQLGDFQPVLWSALLAWILIPLGIAVFVDEVSKNWKESLFYGAIYGLIVYGVYSFTNFSIISSWTIIMLVLDILWGMFLCSISSLLLKVIGIKW